MKIIGRTVNGYLVEMTDDEIAKAAGFKSHYSDGWQKTNGSRDPNVGSTINVNAAYNYHERILHHQAEAQKAGSFLRALADMMDGSMPDIITLPESMIEEKGAEEDGE